MSDAALSDAALSDAALMGYSRLSLSALSGPTGFRAGSRFDDWHRDLAPPSKPAATLLETTPDPVNDAFMQGYTQGLEAARAEAAQAEAEEVNAAQKLTLSFSRLDEVLEEQLRLRLHDTVIALCEAAIAPLAVDTDMLERRVTKAASMLARADDDRVICIHPHDLRLLAPRLQADWDVRPDPTLERGAIRVEGANGGVEDGPTIWRHAIAEALHQC